MKESHHTAGEIGIMLAMRLGLELPCREGHDLAGPCIACKSSDAFRLHSQKGVAHCFSCDGKWSPFQLAEAVLQNREQAKQLLIELGIFQPAQGEANQTIDPIESIARQKRISAESLRAFGAKKVSANAIELPAYGPNGKVCTTFTMSVQGGKGLFAKGKKAGLFFPHDQGKVRLPRAGETWHIVEGPKDAAALHGLGLLACGLNTCRMAAKFARLFAGVNVILVPDRDRAGEKGSDSSTRVLHGTAKSVRIAVLPAEFKETGGDDVRDILRQQNGRELLMQAVADAKAPSSPDAATDEADAAEMGAAVARAEIALGEGDPIVLEVSAISGKEHRLVVAKRGEKQHRDCINPDSSISRNRFIKEAAGKFEIEQEKLATLIEDSLAKLTGEIDAHSVDTGDREKSAEASDATAAANLAVDWELFHTPGDEAYVTFTCGHHRQTWAIRSQTVKRFLARQFFNQFGKAINSEALSAAINLIEAQALFDGEVIPVYVRVAEHEGAIYLDLCNEAWQVVRINVAGWQVIDDAPIRFRRSRGMIALPMPERGGNINELRGFLNVDDNSWVLILAWLISALRPRGPYPILALFAEQGAGKSTTGRLLRNLVDPNTAPLRAEPKDARDLMIAANNSWTLCFDNLSYIAPWMSDAMCRLSTGGGFATRELYTNQDEIIFDSQRPALLTSIEEVATRSDILDRCLIVSLAAIPEKQRRTEQSLFNEFEQKRPRILGALLDALVVALKRLTTTELATLPRMADFAVWATAAETGLKLPEGAFIAAYNRNREAANEVAMETAVIAQPLVNLLEKEGGWSGTTTELLTALEERITDQIKRERGWPKNARSLSGHLKRLAPNLRARGWSVEQERTSKTRRWVISRVAVAADSQPTNSSSEEGSQSGQSDEPWFEAGANDADDAKCGQTAKPWNSDRY